jgi:hypothetical protein
MLKGEIKISLKWQLLTSCSRSWAQRFLQMSWATDDSPEASLQERGCGVLYSNLGSSSKIGTQPIRRPREGWRGACSPSPGNDCQKQHVLAIRLNGGFSGEGGRSGKLSRIPGFERFCSHLQADRETDTGPSVGALYPGQRFLWKLGDGMRRQYGSGTFALIGC